MKWIPAFLVIVLASVWGWRQHRSGVELRQHVERLKPQAEEAATLAAQNAGWKELTVDTNELQQLRRDHRDLLRLRGEIGELRDRGQLTRENLEQRIAEARAQAESDRRESDLLVAWSKAGDLSKRTMGCLAHCAGVIVETARQSGHNVPRSWSEVQQALDRTWSPSEKRPPEQTQRMQAHLRSWFKSASEESNNLADFEFLPVPPGLDLAKADAGRPVLLLRERQPRLQPDGQWARGYAFLDGDVREATSASPDFTGWEAEARTGPP